MLRSESSPRTKSEYDAILRALEKPLRFAEKNDFSHIDSIKGLDRLIPELVDKGLGLSQDAACRELLCRIRNLFHDYAQRSPERRIQGVRQALELIDDLKKISCCGESLPEPKPPLENFGVFLQAPLHSIKGIGPKLCDAFSRLHLDTVEDLLYLLPRSYTDRRHIKKIRSLRPGEHATIIGSITDVDRSSFSRRKKGFALVVSDDTQPLFVKWFRLAPQYASILRKKFPVGTRVIVSGTVSSFRLQHEMHHPEIEPLAEGDEGDDVRAIIPVYPLTEGLRQKTVRRILRTVLDSAVDSVAEYLPERIRSIAGLVPLREALVKVHIPDNAADYEALTGFSSPYHRRIVFDEFFLLQLGLALKKHHNALTPGISFTIPEERLSDFIRRLPFKLTGAQQKCLDEIFADMRSAAPMNRLIQGDVGSGKTAVALIAAMVAIWNGYQAALMAPTEILVEQHYTTIGMLTRNLAVTTVRLTGSQPKACREDVLKLIAQGGADLIIGTHALIQSGVHFHKLGLAIVDEQHKFGVMQRSEIKKKGACPDVLVMTATPIPRTLGLTVYGDLDISLVDELPPGRKPVATRVYDENRRETVYGIVRSELRKKRQVFIVYPLVEESENTDIKDATRMAAHLQQDVFSGYAVGLVHGRMSALEKDAVMNAFKEGRINVLVATTVIEVGIDVPSASLMIIEHAERFGLSQLHQLRGRVGRGGTDSLCILLAQYNHSDEARKRLTIMAQTNDGFKIAEADLAIRGPGEMLGIRQSGLPDFRVAHLCRDAHILLLARRAAFDVVARDPNLSLPENQLLKNTLLLRWKGRLELAGVG